MKICFIGNISDNHTRKWIKYFSECGNEIHWISLPSKYLSEAKGFKNTKIYILYDFRFKALNIIFNALKTRAIVKKIKPDVLHAHYAGVNGALAAFSGFHPFILTAFGSDILIASRSEIKKFIIRFALRKADLITCNGEPLKKEMIRIGANPSKIRFIYWATDTNMFHPAGKNEELMNKLGLEGFFTIISIRNLESVYNVETLIKAIPIVLKEIPKVKFIIAGKGSDEANLKRLAELLKVSRSVKFIGWVDEDDVCDYFNLSDVYVSTSLSDGDLSQSTQQAMACEVPIITTDLEVNIKRIINKVNGLIFSAKDFSLLADQIIFLFRNKKLAEKIAKEGRKMILSELDYYINMKKAENIYSEAIKNYAGK